MQGYGRRPESVGTLILRKMCTTKTVYNTFIDIQQPLVQNGHGDTTSDNVTAPLGAGTLGAERLPQPSESLHVDYTIPAAVQN